MIARAGLVAVITLVIGGCAAPPHVVHPHRSPVPSSSPTTSTADLPFPCEAATMTARMGSSNSAAGHAFYVVVLTNNGSQPCSVKGYPTIALMAGTAQLPTSWADGNDGVTSVSTEVLRLRVPVGSSVFFVLQFSGVPTGSQSCPDATWLSVRLPGESQGTLASTDIAPCGGAVVVSPFQPSTTTVALPCGASTTSATMGTSDSGVGHMVDAVVLTNNATQACTLEGYPTVTLLAGTTPLPTTQTDGNDGITSVSITPTLLTLPVSGSVSFVLQFSDVPAGAASCPGATWLLVQLPGGTVGTLASTDITPCGGAIYTSPFRAGTAPP